MKLIKLTVRLFWDNGGQTVNTTIRARNPSRELIEVAARNFAAMEVSKMKLGSYEMNVQAAEVTVQVVAIEDDFYVTL